MQRKKTRETESKRVALVGAGGNIGSHVICHLGRMPEVDQVILIDRDLYEEKNLLSQDIMPSDVGRSKAKTQARRLRRINPGLDVVAIHDAVENVPLGVLRCDVILTGLDSRVARQYVNQAAWRLGVPWIDTGVDAGGLLARMNVYAPGLNGACCLECSWDQQDYDMLEQEFPCQDDNAPPSTNAPSCLGALAASLQVTECLKLLAGQWDRVAVGCQVLIDASHHKYYMTAFSHNPQCRFDHNVWKIEKLTHRLGQVTLDQALELGARRGEGLGSSSLRVEGHLFVKKLTCPRCGEARTLLYLGRRLLSKQRTCRRCRTEMVAGGFDMLDKLDSAQLSPRLRKGSLKNLGFRSGDVFAVCRQNGEAHYEIDPA